MYKRLTTAALVGLSSMPVLAGVEVTGAWVRALPPTQPTTAAYLSIVNTGQDAQTVRGASAAIAGRVEIHTSREVDGLMRMEQLQQLELAPGSSVRLEPGGTHLMLLELERMPAPGATVDICLELGSGKQVCTEAEVRKSAGGPGGHHHHHHQE